MASQSSSSTSKAYLGSALVSMWNLSTRGANAIATVAQKTYEESAHKKALPIFNAFSAKCCRVLPRMLAPYPFKSVSSMIDFMMNEASRQVEESYKTEIFPPIPFSPNYPVFYRTFLDQVPLWLNHIQEDLRKDPNHSLLERLKSTLDILDYEPAQMRLDPILKPFLEKTCEITRSSFVPQQLLEETQIALGKILLEPEEYSYIQHLVALVQLSIETLSKSDHAMRFIGNGNFRDGRDRLYNQTTDSARLVAIYAVILELTDYRHHYISNKVREEKVLAARALIQNKTIQACLEIFEQASAPQEEHQHHPPLITHIKELAVDLTSFILTIPIFQLSSKDKTTDTVNLFSKAYQASITCIERV